MKKESIIRKARKEKELSQIEVASRVGVALLTYQLWERGAGRPSPKNREKLEEVLGINLDGLYQNQN